MTVDIIVAAYQIRKPNPEFPNTRAMDVFAVTAGVSSLSSRIERSGSYVSAAIGREWAIDRELNTRRLVKIKLPDGVLCGQYSVCDLTLVGLYASYAASDGMGKTVYAFCPVATVGDDSSTAITDAIAGGIQLSVPAPDGSRTDIPAKIVAVSDQFTAYQDKIPEDWNVELF